MDEYEVIPLYTRQDLLHQTVQLLNSQWPRSETARIRTLEQNKDDSLPISLLLVLKPKDGGGTLKVVGHSKLLPVPSRPTECFVESVVIDSSLRGKGLGRRIMAGTENFAKSKGITTVNLTTHDQQGFYERLGYEESEPIVVYGGVASGLQKIIANHSLQTTDAPHNLVSRSTSACIKVQSSPSSLPVPSIPPPPPPPCSNPQIIHCGPAKVYMCKILK